MPPTFIFPPKLHALEAEPEPEDSCLSVDCPVDVASLRSSDVEQFVKGLSFDLSDRELFCIQDQDVFDRVYSVVKGFANLPPPCKFNIVECLRSNFSVLLPNVESICRNSLRNGGNNGYEPPASDSIFSHRNAFKIYTFFLVQILLAEHSNCKSTNNSKVLASAKKKSPMNSWNWEIQRARILSLIANSLELNLSLLFGSSDPDDNYLAFIAKNALSFFENAILLKDSNAKDALCRIVATCSTKYHYTAQSCASILHLLHKYDFVVIPMVDAVALAEKKFADGSLATSLIREIGRTSPKDYVKDAAGAENIGRFLVEIADRLPKLISSNVGILVPHFGGESYKIRNALIGVLGKLVAKAFKDVEGEVSSKSVRLRAKQAMSEILLERCRDVSAYTRSRALQVWSELCEQHAISIGFWNEVAAVAAGRLEDKSAIVRKSALNLLIMMLQHNPFGPQLQIASFEATLNEYKEKLNELQPEVNDVSTSDKMLSDPEPCDGLGEVDHVGSDTNVPEHPDSVTDSYLSQAEERTLPKDSSLPDIGNLEQTKVLVASLEAGLTFAKSVASVMPVLVQLMASSSATDVENTILLLMSCRQFQIEGSETCLRQMLPLVFSQDKSIFEAVENAFTTIYITKNHLETSKNLLSLAVTSNIGDLAALEHIISVLVSKGDISSGVISALWDFFCFNTSKTTAEQSRGALSILCMAAKSSSKVLNAHLQDIIDIGFGRWAKVDPLLARTACIALQRLPEEEKKKILTGAASRLFGILESLITGFWLPDSLWYGAADKAIGAIYALHPTPEAIAVKLIKKTLMSVFGSGDINDLQQEADNSVNDIPSVAQVGKLSRYLYVTSHVAMNQLLYIECCVKKIQKQKVVKERMAAENNNIDNTSINAELGIAASEDAKLDSLFTKAEKEIISWDCVDTNLIGCCAPFLSKLCRNFSLMQKYPELQASAMLALCRFMIIDADFCEANLQLLFTVVDNSPSETVRSNCTIALGDLAVRFPNLVEPWTENMYSRLRDPSVSVRKNAVLVLSHLILNDMMKVKGHIYEMAMRLEDEDERISNLAKLFFTELSKKGNNPIYNLLPDILGKLFNQNLKRESFCNIMQFLIGSIKKDKQMEGLVEKLCNRFCGITDCSQWECTSYCLSQLTFTEKGMKKLMESFKTYEHALSEASVLEHFKSIISKAKKFAKPDMKACVEEFEQKLNKFHADKKEQEVTAKNAQAHSQKAGNLDKFIASTEVKEEVLDPEAAEVSEDGTDGEVLDPCGEEAPNSNDNPESNTCEPNNESTTSSVVSQLEDGKEVMQPLIDVSLSKARKAKGKSRGGSAQLEDDNEQVQPLIDVSISKAKAQGKSRQGSVTTSIRKSTRSRR